MLDKDGKRMLVYVQEVIDVDSLYFTKDNLTCGKHVGDTLMKLLEEVLEHSEYNNKEKLLSLAKAF